MKKNNKNKEQKVGRQKEIIDKSREPPKGRIACGEEIMVGVTGKLKMLFPQYTIYTDQIEQGLVDPYFFVSIQEPKERLLIGQRYFRETQVSVRFFAGDTEDTSRYLNSMAEILWDGLEYITLSDSSLLRGTGIGEYRMQCETIGKVGNSHLGTMIPIS